LLSSLYDGLTDQNLLLARRACTARGAGQGEWVLGLPKHDTIVAERDRDVNQHVSPVFGFN
jgi:hypothetical protein